MDLEIFLVAPGAWGYRVGGHHQAHDPELPGHEPMTEARARALGEALKARLEAIEVGA